MFVISLLPTFALRLRAIFLCTFSCSKEKAHKQATKQACRRPKQKKRKPTKSLQGLKAIMNKPVHVFGVWWIQGREKYVQEENTAEIKNGHKDTNANRGKLWLVEAETSFVFVFFGAAAAALGPCKKSSNKYKLRQANPAKTGEMETQRHTGVQFNGVNRSASNYGASATLQESPTAPFAQLLLYSIT